MNSSRSFSLLAVVLVVVAGAAGTAAAVTISSQDTPAEARVGDRVSATYVFADLYQDPQYEQWTLQGETGLASVTWTVQLVDQTGAVTDQTTYDGSVFNGSVSAEAGTAEVRVQLTGTVPEVGNWSYAARQPVDFAAFRLVRQGGTSTVIGTFEAPRYTQESREAREAIESARAAVGSGGNQQAERTLESAVSAYNAGNFENAIRLAEQAEGTAKSARQQSQLIQLAILVVVGLLVVGAVVGAVYWYRSQQSQSKL